MTPLQGRGRPARAGPGWPLAAERVLVLGTAAMGTMIQGYKLEEADDRGERRSTDWPSTDLEGHQRPPGADPARTLNRRDPPAVHGRAGRDIISKSNTFNGKTHSASAGTYGHGRSLVDGTTTFRGGVASYGGARGAPTPMTEKTPGQAAFRRRRGSGRLIQDAVAVAGCERPRLPGDQLRRGSKEAYRQAGSRRWSRPVSYHRPDRDDLHHPQRQGGDLRGLGKCFDQIGETLPVYDLRHDYTPILIGPAPCPGQTTGGPVLELPCAHAEPFLGRPGTCAFVTASEDTANLYRGWSLSRDRRRCGCRPYPNAGLPNEFGEYDQMPGGTGRLHRSRMGRQRPAPTYRGVGGCCGTTPAHIAAIAGAVEGKPPRGGAPSCRCRMRLQRPLSRSPRFRVT